MSDLCAVRWDACPPSLTVCNVRRWLIRSQTGPCIGRASARVLKAKNITRRAGLAVNPSPEQLAAGHGRQHQRTEHPARPTVQ